jgi:uncharacterized protein (TIGR03118 family)
VLIPTVGADSGGAPTGIVFNSTTGFVIPSTGQASRFIFAGEDGILSAWSSGNNALVVADRSADSAVYKGLALAQDGAGWFLYAANFRGMGVDVFDDHFKRDTTRRFSDPGIPAGYGPFNIQAINGYLYVSYAKLKGPDNMDDESGPGNGYVDIFRPDGHMVRRLASRGALNSPWGLAALPASGNDGDDDIILVGNFGDGRVNMFHGDGKYAGQLTDSTGKAVTVPGLWALEFGTPLVSVFNDSTHHGRGSAKDSVDIDTLTTQRLYFTAGPNDENDGLFGYFLIPQLRQNHEHHGEGDDHHGDHEADNHGGRGKGGDKDHGRHFGG